MLLASLAAATAIAVAAHGDERAETFPEVPCALGEAIDAQLSLRFGRTVCRQVATIPTSSRNP